MNEPSQPSEAGDAAPEDDDETDHPMPPETEHVLWDLLVGDGAPDGESD